MSKISYRKDIDGLRAVAVLLVIFAHVKISYLAGGFIGVDVFFVISGFLITSIIKKELDQGTFSFIDFYMRRVRRILPALVFLIGGTIALSIVILLPSDLIVFAQSVISGITAWSNIFFSNVSLGYWGKNIAVMPLAHLWSLAVEEQFYFIWPATFFCLYFFVPKKYLGKILLTIILLLFILSIYQTQTPKAYYRVTARAFELMLGVFVAIKKEHIISVTNRVPSIVISSLGLGLIALSTLLLKEGAEFPGWNALWPCLGAALLIIPPTKHNIVVRWLESSPLVYIGKISYSLYLWHWPFIALLFYSGNTIEEWRWLAVLFSFLAAIISYHMVEQPFRKSNDSSWKLLKKLFLTPVVGGAVFLLIVQSTNGMAFRYSPRELWAIQAKDLHTAYKYPGCQASSGSNDNSLLQLTNPLCIWGGNDASKAEVLLVGDSHAAALRGFLEVLSKNAKLSGIQITKGGAPYLPDINFYDGPTPSSIMYYPGKTNHNRMILEYIRKSKAKYVVFGGMYTTYIQGSNEINYIYGFGEYLSRKENITKNKVIFEEAFDSAIKEVVKLGKYPIIFKDVPEMSRDWSYDGLRDALRGTRGRYLPESDVRNRQKHVDAFIDKLRKKYSVYVVDLKDLICQDGFCYPSLDDVPLYYDSNHLNYYGSRYLGKKYLEKYNNFLKN